MVLRRGTERKLVTKQVEEGEERTKRRLEMRGALIPISVDTMTPFLSIPLPFFSPACFFLEAVGLYRAPELSLLLIFAEFLQ